MAWCGALTVALQCLPYCSFVLRYFLAFWSGGLKALIWSVGHRPGFSRLWWSSCLVWRMQLCWVLASTGGFGLFWILVLRVTRVGSSVDGTVEAGVLKRLSLCLSPAAFPSLPVMALVLFRIPQGPWWGLFCHLCRWEGRGRVRTGLDKRSFQASRLTLAFPFRGPWCSISASCPVSLALSFPRSILSTTKRDRGKGFQLQWMKHKATDLILVPSLTPNISSFKWVFYQR